MKAMADRVACNHCSSFLTGGFAPEFIQSQLLLLALLNQAISLDLQRPYLLMQVSQEFLLAGVGQHLLLYLSEGEVIQTLNIHMSKKYFINNLDTPFGQALLSELVKEPTEDPVHMCTVRVPVAQKPSGIKKVLKREKPKLFRKKVIEECEVYVYSLDQTELTDIDFAIETMGKPFEDNKVFILVSDIMVWSNSPRKVKKDPPPPPPEVAENAEQPVEPKPEEVEAAEEGKEEDEEGSEQEMEAEKPIEYTFYEEGDYEARVPLPNYQFMREVEDKVLGIKRENVKVFVVCPGIIYGCGEDTFYPLFKAAWLQEPAKLPYLGEGLNKLPTIHLKDLVRFVVKVAEAPPEGSPYLFAFDQTDDRSQRAIIQAISSGIGSGKIQSVKETKLIENEDRDRYLIDLDMRSSKLLIGTAQEPVEFEWVSRKGIGSSIQLLLQDFTAKEALRPIKFLLLQPDAEWKQSKTAYILKAFADYYRIPVLSIKGILQNAKEFGDEELAGDLREEWAAISSYLSGDASVNGFDETMKVFYRAVRWRLSQNDCKNRGYILQNFPRFTPELDFIFNKLNLKKLKRNKPKPIPAKPTEKSIRSDDEIPPPEEPKEEEPPAEEPAEEEAGQEQAGPKTEPYYPQSIISIKRMGHAWGAGAVVDFFTSRGMEELVYDTSHAKDHEIFESLRSYLERNGRPNNYLVHEDALLQQHRDFTAKENQDSLDRRAAEERKREQTDAEVQARRKKLAEEVCELVRNEGEEEIKKMPFRNYLMEFVVPTLNVGLLEVSNIIPNDPVDLLAEFLYQKSYDA